tara:strand:+ start:328 stop:489 length:162 start_codon:yes stop_codon:yes gene_type:complete
MAKDTIESLKQDKKMYWKIIQTLQNLLYEQFQRESDLLDDKQKLMGVNQPTFN